MNDTNIPQRPTALARHAYAYWRELNRPKVYSVSHDTLARGRERFGDREYFDTLTGYFHGEALVRQQASQRYVREQLARYWRARV